MRMMMAAEYLASPMLTTFRSTLPCRSFVEADSTSLATSKLLISANSSSHHSAVALLRQGVITSAYRNSAAQVDGAVIHDEDEKTWESCKEELSTYGFDSEEEDKILGKAFGRIHSSYWGEERKKEVPKLEVVIEILSYLRDLGLTDSDLGKLIKKFPEVLGCNLENEVKENVQILEQEWGIKGKTLRNLLLRNPRVLGYNIDCKGDCQAQCTRCWARF